MDYLISDMKNVVINGLFASEVDSTMTVFVLLLLFLWSIYGRISKGKKEGRKYKWYGLFFFYIYVVLSYTLLSRTQIVSKNLELTLFWSYERIFLHQDKKIAMEVFENILFFIPFGILEGKLLDKKKHGLIWIAFSAAGLSIGIEAMQYLTRLGLCETDDVIHNALGALIGYGMYRMGRKWFGRKKG